MFCKNCGKEIDDNAFVCPFCGVQVGELLNNKQNAEDNILAVLGFVCSFGLAIVGLVCSLLGYNNAKKGAPYKNLAFAGIIISAVSIILSFVAIIVTIVSFTSLINSIG